jgi:hypothetical protein
MSSYPDNPARPVGPFVIAFLMVLFAAFLLLVRYYYSPTATAPQNAAAEKMPKELEWRATATSRRAALNESQAEQAKLATSYGWVDQKAGVVRLPIERAMELMVKEQPGQPAAPRGR